MNDVGSSKDWMLTNSPLLRGTMLILSLFFLSPRNHDQRPRETTQGEVSQPRKLKSSAELDPDSRARASCPIAGQDVEK